MGRKRESKTAVNLPPEARIDGKVSNFQVSMNKYAIKRVKGSMANHFQKRGDLYKVSW